MSVTLNASNSGSGGFIVTPDSSGVLAFQTAGTTALTLDTNQNMGLGVTPSAWVSQRVLELPNGVALSSYTGGVNSLQLTNNAYFGSGNWTYKGTGYALQYSQNQLGQHVWYNAPSGSAPNAITFTQAMTLDASGRLQLGTTTATGALSVVAPASTEYGAFDALTSGYAFLRLRYNGTAYGNFGQAVAVISGGSATDFGFNATNNMLFATNGTTERMRIKSTGDIKIQAGNLLGWSDYSAGSTGVGLTAITSPNENLLFYTTGSERARIDSSGNLLVGTTTQIASALITNNGSYSQNGNQMNYNSANTTIEFVNRNGGGAKTFSWYYGSGGTGSPATLSTSGVWTNASDSRGKENIADINYGLSTVLNIKARQFDVKSDNSHAIGFIAQELKEVLPEVVHVTMTDSENQDWYGVDYGAITSVLVKAIQEQQQIINDLQAKLKSAGIAGF